MGFPNGKMHFYFSHHIIKLIPDGKGKIINSLEIILTCERGKITNYRKIILINWVLLKLRTGVYQKKKQQKKPPRLKRKATAWEKTFLIHIPTQSELFCYSSPSKLIHWENQKVKCLAYGYPARQQVGKVILKASV